MPEYGNTVLLGIGGTFVVGIGALLVGAVLMVVWSFFAEAKPFFAGESLNRETPGAGAGGSRGLPAQRGRRSDVSIGEAGGRVPERRPLVRQRHLVAAAARRHHRGEPGPDAGPGGARPRGAGRVCDGATVHLRRAGRGDRRLRARSRRSRGPQGRPGRASGRRTVRSGCSSSTRTAKLGAILVNINPAYRTHELAYVLQQAGISVLVSAPGFKTSDYRAMVADVRSGVPGAARGDLPRRSGLGDAAGRRPIR